MRRWVLLGLPTAFGYNAGGPFPRLQSEAVMSTDATVSKPAPFEFTDEHNRTISGLADGMRTTATLLQLLGLAFAILCGLQVAAATPGQPPTQYGPAVGLGAAALLCLAIGFWTSSAAKSFRRVVETRNEDVWHLMNALSRLRAMYSLIRTIVLGVLVLAVVGLALLVISLVQRG
jgi:hypothetical protein